MNVHIAVPSYAFCAVAFALLAALVAFSKTGNRYKVLLLIAAGATAAWAASVVATQLTGRGITAQLFLEVVRYLGWLAFLCALLGVGQGGQPSRLQPTAAWLTAGISGTGLILIVAGYVAVNIDAGDDLLDATRTLAATCRLLLTVLGLLLLENLFRNADEENRWATKHLCFGLGAVFAYDFYLFADATLFNRINTDLFTARGFVNALVVPLVAVSISRARSWGVNIHVSRRIVFHSAALIGTGLYLLGMAAAGFYLRRFGGEWGTVFQILFLSGALMILMVIFASGSVRAGIKVWISKNFFSYSYDYREEWLRFTQTISLDEAGTGLHDRIIRAIADIIETTAGALWVRREEDRAFLPTASWHFRGNLSDGRLPAVPVDSPLATFLETRQWIVDLRAMETEPDLYPDLDVPNWIRQHPRAGFIVPLVHRESLRAFLVTGRPRAERAMDWEVFDLLKAVGRQAASYLAEEQAANALSDARQIEAFNRRFAFVVHDIKNLVSQMSLMMKNAERFGDNPDFQKDMLATVGNTVIRMQDLLQQFKAERSPDANPVKPAPLGAMVVRVGNQWRRQKPDLVLEVPDGDVTASINAPHLVTVLDHLLQNAVEAAGAEGRIGLRLAKIDAEAMIEVTDNGPGMDETFIRDELFRPLRTEKGQGFGLGAFQARQLVRDMGGRLEVASVLGEGTTMRVVFPVATDPSDADSGGPTTDGRDVARSTTR